MFSNIATSYSQETDYPRSKKSSSSPYGDNPEVAAEVGEADWPGSKTIKNKKDLEYMAYQADPSLTVENLSVQPQISFRKQQQVDSLRRHYNSDDTNNAKVHFSINKNA